MERLERKALVHTHPGMKLDDFMTAIDNTGGWPVAYKFVQFFHGDWYTGRTCVFTNSGANTEWWTTVCTADDYYWWKISEVKKAEVKKEIRRQLISQLQTM